MMQRHDGVMTDDDNFQRYNGVSIMSGLYLFQGVINSLGENKFIVCTGSNTRLESSGHDARCRRR